MLKKFDFLRILAFRLSWFVEVWGLYEMAEKNSTTSFKLFHERAPNFIGIYIKVQWNFTVDHTGAPLFCAIQSINQSIAGIFVVPPTKHGRRRLTM